MTPELDIAASWAVEQGVLVEYLTCHSVPVLWLDKTVTYNVSLHLCRELQHTGVAKQPVENETNWTGRVVDAAAPAEARGWFVDEAKVPFCNWVRKSAEHLQKQAAQWATGYHARGHAAALVTQLHYEQHLTAVRQRISAHRDALYDLGLVQKWVHQ